MKKKILEKHIRLLERVIIMQREEIKHLKRLVYGERSNILIISNPNQFNKEYDEENYY